MTVLPKRPPGQFDAIGIISSGYREGNTIPQQHKTPPHDTSDYRVELPRLGRG